MSSSTKASVKTRGSKTGNSSSHANKTNVPAPINSPIDQISFLQRTVGNREVERLLKSGVIQDKLTIGQAGAKPVFRPQTAAPPSAPATRAKLKVGEPDDEVEQEADRVAELTENGNGSILASVVAQSRSPVGSLQGLLGNRPVLQMRHGSGGPPAPAVPLRLSQSGILQRKCACGSAAGMSGECEECSKKKRLGLQTKLKVNDPGDVYEQEADRIADQVMAAPAHSVVSGAPPRIQRFSGQSNEQVDAAPASVNQALASRGRPLEPALRQDMEQRFGHDFSSVRVHTGAQAHDSARSLRALAYTVGNDVVFGTGQYASDTRAGRSLIAHELTHVVQQGGGDGPGHAHRMVQRQPDPAQQKEDEHEKDFGSVGPPQPAPAELPGFGDVAPDAACPPLPTNLGRLAPKPPCPTADADITGERFTFCRASDVFSPGSERPRLITWARSQPATSTFVVHGYASESDGTPAQNVNVSCHRAKRVARELYNAGVRSERIEIAARGGTTRFGTGAGKLTLNRRGRRAGGGA